MDEMPVEIVLAILKWMEVRTVLAVEGTCSTLRIVACSDPLWCYLCSRDFPRAPSQKMESSWKQQYVKHYRSENEFWSDFTKRVCATPRAAFQVKVALVGDQYVGKTSLMYRFLEGTFSDIPVSRLAGVDWPSKHVVIRGKPIHIQVIDIGMERFDINFEYRFLRIANITLLCFDISNENSFSELRHSRLPRCQQSGPHCVIGLVATKCDLTHAVSVERIQELAREYGIQYFFTSAKAFENVEEPFLRTIDSCMPYLEKFSEKKDFKTEMPSLLDKEDDAPAPRRCYLS